MSGKMIISHGLPGSGKSTIAEKMVSEDPENIIRANRDDIRTALFGESYHSRTPDKESEKSVEHVQHELIRRTLAAGKTVIVDDTNLNPKRIAPLVQLAKTYDAEFEQYYVDVPVDECKRRNKLRGEQGGRYVPDEIIDSMAKNAYGDDGHLKEFVISSDGKIFAVERSTEGSRKVDAYNAEIASETPANGKALVVLDMDGTLFNNSKDSMKFLNSKNQKKDFEGFYKSILQAPVNTKVRDMVNSMYDNDNLTIVAVTGRTDDYAEELITALKNSNTKISRLYMKRAGDNRPSKDHKKDVVEKMLNEGYIITHAIDDRAMDLRMFQDKGIMTSRVKTNMNPNTIDDNNSDPEIETVYGSGHCIRCGSKLKNGGNIGKVCATKQNI